jgi:hypothetical protein
MPTTITASLPSTVGPIGGAVSQTDPLLGPSNLLADYIDPGTKEYLSLTRGMDPIDAQALIALSYIRAAGPATEQDGNKLRDIKKMGSVGKPAGQDRRHSERDAGPRCVRKR